jgi:hypothetical protein
MTLPVMCLQHRNTFLTFKGAEMKFYFVKLTSLAAMLAAMGAYAGAQDASPNMQLMGANARLINTVDTKKVSPGEAITAKLTSTVKEAGSVELPKGTLLIGRVDQVQPSANGSPATLSVTFDQAKLSDGRTVPVKATLLGAYPENAGDYYVETGNGGALIGGLPASVPADQKIDQEPGALGNVEMRSAVQSSASGVFSSKNRNIDLKSGTQLQVAIAPEAPTATRSGN